MRLVVLPRRELEPQTVLQLEVERGEADGRLAQQALPPQPLASVCAHAQAQTVHVLCWKRGNCQIMYSR